MDIGLRAGLYLLFSTLCLLVLILGMIKTGTLLFLFLVRD